MIKYTIASLLSSGLDLLAFTLINKLTNNIILSSYLARIISSIFNYFLNKKYVFKSTDKKSFIGYFILVFVNITVSGIIVNFLDSLVNINTTVIKAIIDILIYIVNYIIQKFLIFKK